MAENCIQNTKKYCLWTRRVLFSRRFLEAPDNPGPSLSIDVRIARVPVAIPHRLNSL